MTAPVARGKLLWQQMGGKLDPAGLQQTAGVLQQSSGVFPLRIGVDVARWGLDHGTIYARCGSVAWRIAKLSQQDTDSYVGKIRTEALRLLTAGACSSSLHVRVDAGGGYGSGVVDALRKDVELRAAFKDFKVIEAHNNGQPHSPESMRTWSPRHMPTFRNRFLVWPSWIRL